MLKIGTSSWTSPGWEKVFYPEGRAKRDYITHYASRYDIVEIDATFYAIPAESTVKGWKQRTPDGFLFAAKVPQVITHEKMLEGCETELHVFVERMQILEEKLGPILFQFRYFRKGETTVDEFVSRLLPVLDLVPQGVRAAVEVRNKTWLTSELIEPLRERNMALTLIDHPWMPHPAQYASGIDDLITADFTYIRWLGDRRKTEEMLARHLGEVSFEESIMDVDSRLVAWAGLLKRLEQERLAIFAFFNNHFSGYAPADIEKLRELLDA